MAKKIGIVGSGAVGEALATGFLKHGYEVMRGSRDPKKLADWKKSAGASASTGTFAETAKFGEIVVIAAKGTAAEEAAHGCGLENLAGKIVIDTMNPIADSPPVHGVLSFFTGPNDSLLERLQKLAPKARWVKAFSCVGSALMVDPQLAHSARPTMFICGDDAGAKEQVHAILDQFGWESEDMGGVTSARAIEPLCRLWCLPGFLKNDWTHAFKVLRK